MVAPLTVKRVASATAAQLLQACPDPLGSGATDLLAMADRSTCVQISDDASELTMALQLRKGPARDVLWIAGAVGQGAADLTAVGLSHAEDTAKGCKAHAVGFQTARRGLVKRAQAKGYRVAGFILIKDLP